MSKRVRFKFYKKGLMELMREPEMLEAVEEAGQKVAAAAHNVAGADYESDARIGPHRAVAIVKASNVKAYRSALKHNTFEKALGSVH